MSNPKQDEPNAVKQLKGKLHQAYCKINRLSQTINDLLNSRYHRLHTNIEYLIDQQERLKWSVFEHNIKLHHLLKSCIEIFQEMQNEINYLKQQSQNKQPNSIQKSTWQTRPEQKFKIDLYSTQNIENKIQRIDKNLHFWTKSEIKLTLKIIDYEFPVKAADLLERKKIFEQKQLSFKHHIQTKEKELEQREQELDRREQFSTDRKTALKRLERGLHQREIKIIKAKQTLGNEKRILDDREYYISTRELEIRSWDQNFQPVYGGGFAFYQPVPLPYMPGLTIATHKEHPNNPTNSPAFLQQNST